MTMALLAAMASLAEEPETESLTGGKVPALRTPAAEIEAQETPIDALVGLDADEIASLPWDPEVYLGAQVLDLPVDLVGRVHQGVHRLYERNYEGARSAFREVDAQWPGLAMGAVGEALVWQAKMLENFDLRYEAQWAEASKRARTGLEAGLKVPGRDAFEHLLLTGVVGIESIHSMRKGNYLPALQLAFQAMDHVHEATELAPKFPDLKLADGMYNYWRSVVTLTSDLLPDFTDRRAEGLGQMQSVERDGVFLGPMATLALTFSYAEAGETKEALGAALRNKERYPHNVINNLVTGSLYGSSSRHEAALAVYAQVLETDPSNRRVHYWRGVALQNLGRLDEALVAYRTYGAFDGLEKWQAAAVAYRTGQIHQKQGRLVDAEASFKAAVQLDGHAGAKRALAKLKERQAPAP